MLFLFSGKMSHLLGLTLTLDILYKDFEKCKNAVEEHLGKEDNKVERRQMKMLLHKLTFFKPMTAKGYFNVTKDTLVSMLSVR